MKLADFLHLGSTGLKGLLVVMEHSDLPVNTLAKFLAERYTLPDEKPLSFSRLSERDQKRWRSEAAAILREIRAMLA